VAAGNENRNACNVSPASASAVFTTASSTSGDVKSSFSNWGSCVEAYAPGSSITSTWNNGGYATISGTSMASPHVAGAVALIWSRSQTLRRNIAATRSLLDNGAKDKSDLTCGGTADDNNVWGEGLLDCLGPVREAPQP
jgi:subtilisin family serine protease